jgi:osmotically-inducible protein OsmY
MMATVVRSGAQMRVPNHVIAMDVKEELDWDPTLNARRIQVEAKDGRITLRGAVNTFADVARAGADAWAVRGVRAVDNELQVGLAGGIVADADIHRDCTRILNADPFVPDGAVVVRVGDGWVTLTGEVSHHHHRRAAELAVARVAGVLGVTNKIALTRGTPAGDTAARIEKAFARQAIIDSSGVEVSNVGDIVYLDGHVATWAAMEAAVDTAWCAPGVTEVVNRLAILP